MYHSYKRRRTRKSKLKNTHLEETLLNLPKFLNHVGLGEQKEAEEMLKQDAYLCFEFGNLIDPSKREFKNITAFQYALWALDFHMWQMILKYLPDKQARFQVSLFIKRRNEEPIFCDWQPLIDALQTYINYRDVWGYDQLKNYWVSIIGGAQTLLPAHVINEYHNILTNFISVPENTYQNILSRTGVKLWFNLATSGEILKLGENFAWTRGNNEIALPRLIPNIQYLGVGDLLKSEEIDKIYLKSLLSFRKGQVNMLIRIMSQNIIYPRLSFSF